MSGLAILMYCNWTKFEGIFLKPKLDCNFAKVCMRLRDLFVNVAPMESKQKIS